jgi:hypothetical protein
MYSVKNKEEDEDFVGGYFSYKIVIFNFSN